PPAQRLWPVDIIRGDAQVGGAGGDAGAVSAAAAVAATDPSGSAGGALYGETGGDGAGGNLGSRLSAESWRGHSATELWEGADNLYWFGPGSRVCRDAERRLTGLFPYAVRSDSGAVAQI